ncbi:MAG: hypothetical protein AAGA29_04810 [Planctomycetota bacterium]
MVFAFYAVGFVLAVVVSGGVGIGASYAAVARTGSVWSLACVPISLVVFLWLLLCVPWWRYVF